jgi:hypothetical protein
VGSAGPAGGKSSEVVNPGRKPFVGKRSWVGAAGCWSRGGVCCGDAASACAGWGEGQGAAAGAGA